MVVSIPSHGHDDWMNLGYPHDLGSLHILNTLKSIAANTTGSATNGRATLKWSQLPSRSLMMLWDSQMAKWNQYTSLHSSRQSPKKGWIHIIWVNYNISLTKAIWGWFPFLTMIPVRSQWGRYNLPRYHVRWTFPWHVLSVGESEISHQQGDPRRWMDGESMTISPHNQ